MSQSTTSGVRVAIGLGSNLGDRERHLQDAVTGLAQFVSHLRVSSFYETTPVGVGDDQPMFINAAAIGETVRTAADVLDALLAVEQALGRTRPYRGAPRTIDLDLILYGDDVIEMPGLIVPHPRFRERRFVLEPLAELAPDWIDPVTGKTIAALLRLVVA